MKYTVSLKGISIRMNSRQIWEEFGIDIDSVVTLSDIRKVFSLYSIQVSSVLTEYGFANTIYVVDRWTNQTVRVYKFDGGFEVTLSTMNKCDFDNALFYPATTSYRRSINSLRFQGVPYRTYIDEKGDMIIRYNEYGDDYTEEVYDTVGTLIRVIDVEDGYIHIQD